MTRILRFLAVAFGLAAAVPAPAAFHLWEMTELYSNADGTVQFLELRALTGGQQFMAGHNLTSTGTAGGSNSFTFPANLPGDTLGRTMLVATQGFAALGIVAPDYVVPNGFFFRAGGTINFAESSDVWNHGALPTDNRSTDRFGNASAPTPTNFAGQTGTVSIPNPPAPLNFQGLWYRGEVERGWGLNIAHQGDNFFVTWFTYDTDGGQMWLVGPDVRRGAGNSYAGALFRTTGPAFDSVPFNPASIGFAPAGSLQLDFVNESEGTFSYVVNGVPGSKPIVRQVFATLPTCAFDGIQGANLNFQGLWYAFPAESERGWGVNLTHQGDILFATWFTYEASGRGMWIVGPRLERTSGNTFTGGLFRTTGPAFSAQPWNPEGVAPIPVGTGTFTFTSATSGSFTYTVNGVTQTKAITPQNFSAPATTCR